MKIVDHTQASELFSAYWEKDLTPEQVKALEEHMHSCVVCKKEFEEFKQTMAAATSLGKMEAPVDFGESLRDRIRRRSRGRFFGPKKLRDRIPYEIFSLIMLGMVLAAYLIYQLSQPILKLP